MLHIAHDSQSFEPRSGCIAAAQMDFFNVTESEAICNCTVFTAPGAPNECSDGTHPYVVTSPAVPAW